MPEGQGGSVSLLATPLCPLTNETPSEEKSFGGVFVMEKPQKNVAVFFGGRSNEAEISVITGMYAVNLLRGTRYRVLPVWLPPEGGMLLGTWNKVSEFAGAVRGTPLSLIHI